jgi:hypothetical protein
VAHALLQVEGSRNPTDVRSLPPEADIAAIEEVRSDVPGCRQPLCD